MARAWKTSIRAGGATVALCQFTDDGEAHGWAVIEDARMRLQIAADRPRSVESEALPGALENVAAVVVVVPRSSAEIGRDVGQIVLAIEQCLEAIR